MRVALTMMCAMFGEDWKRIVGGVGFQRSLIIPEMAENRIGCFELVLIQGIHWYLSFENQSYGSKVACVNTSPTLTHFSYCTAGQNSVMLIKCFDCNDIVLHLFLHGLSKQ